MLEFNGRVIGDLAYLECSLVTDLTDQDEVVPPHRQVDVRLPNNKVLRLPYCWLRQEPEVSEDTPSEVLDAMLDASLTDRDVVRDAEALPPKKVTVRRAPGK